MALIVQKFGGSSVKDRDRIFNVARIVANTHNAGNDVVVVVSAQGDTTDDLIAKAGEITHNPSRTLVFRTRHCESSVRLADLTAQGSDEAVFVLSHSGENASLTLDGRDLTSLLA